MFESETGVWGLPAGSNRRGIPAGAAGIDGVFPVGKGPSEFLLPLQVPQSKRRGNRNSGGRHAGGRLSCAVACGRQPVGARTGRDIKPPGSGTRLGPDSRFIPPHVEWGRVPGPCGAGWRGIIPHGRYRHRKSLVMGLYHCLAGPWVGSPVPLTAAPSVRWVDFRLG